MYQTIVRDTTITDRDLRAVPDTGAHAGVSAEGLGKRFGDLWALRDLSLDVEPGHVLGLLGHNGAGKTTAIRILTTLATPTTGRARVAGFDVSEQPGEVRQRIGVAEQSVTVDGLMSARLNLVMVGRLQHLSKQQAAQRADELLELFDLTDAASRLVKTFSGGMRRRLDLAASLIAAPSVLFLDEPTTGLDPRSRGDLWEMLRTLVNQGTTLVLTTQYLEEADHLADEIIVLDHGRAVAQGSPDQLKASIGTDRVDVSVATVADLPRAVQATKRFAANPASVDDAALVVSIPIVDGTRLMEVMRALDAAGLDALDLNTRRASLDDVFLTLTGAPRDAEPDGDMRRDDEEVPA
jgi:ABC-2 type transport system ATP-binding protein